MNDEQRKFKIRKIDSYKQQISQETKKATQHTFFLGLAAAGMAVGFLGFENPNAEASARLFDMFVGISSTFSGAISLKSLIESISRKTMLQGKVEDINYELEMPENKESRGMKKL